MKTLFQGLERGRGGFSKGWKTETEANRQVAKAAKVGDDFSWRSWRLGGFLIRTLARVLPARMDDAVAGVGSQIASAFFWRSFAIGFGALLAVFASGCASTGMKGTPFYSGEYAKREGPAEERVNLWPLFYYRPPGLSALWPVFEKSDEHLALRPFYSVYGLDREKREYNVLWPLAQFDQQNKDHHILPFFWGGGARAADDYRVGFPLYWHYGHPMDDAVGGLDTLFPLWFLERHGTTRTSVYAPWPFVHYMRDGRRTGWHVFPFAGSYGDGNEYFRFQAALLADQWGNAREGRAGSMVLPFYFYERRKDEWDFYSLPWSSGHTADRDWSCILPLWYHSRDASGTLTVSPFWQHAASANPAQGGWSGALPLLYHSYGPQGSTTLSPLWLARTRSNVNETSWSALLPVYYRGGNQASSLLVTPLWAQGARSNANWQLLLPLYFGREEGADKFWATPFGGLRTAAGQRSWMIYPLLSWGTPRADGGEFWALAPLVHADWTRTNSQSHVVPFYYFNSATRTFLSLAWTRWYGEGTTNSVVPPLLSWVTSDRDSTDLYYALGLGKCSWGARPGAQYLLPVFYRDRQQHMFLSPLWCSWPTDNGSMVVIPPLLAWEDTQPHRTDFHTCLCLGNFSSGARPGAQWFLPFFYQDKRQQTFLSPVWASWLSAGNSTNTCLPFALSWLTEQEQRKDLTVLLGLGNFSWGAKPEASYLLPFFYSDPETKEFYTLLFGRDPGADGFFYYATPLAGVRHGEHTGSWVFPLYSHTRDTKTGDVDDWLLWGNHWKHGGVSRTVFFPLFGYHNFGSLEQAPRDGRGWAHYGKDFFCLPICWYRNEAYYRPAPVPQPVASVSKANKQSAPKPRPTPLREDKFSHGVFPLWSYANNATPAQGRQNIEGSIVLWLYDYLREVEPLTKAPAGTNDYTRARVLWHLWHYERHNGDVSVDLFPGITYDRKTDGYKKISWLWRVFRYERSKDGGKKLDLLCIPFMRRDGNKTDAGTVDTPEGKHE